MNAIAEIFPPGEFLNEELEARGWTQTTLAEIMGRPTRLINEIVAGKKSITPETAVQLGDALGTGPELWMNLESQYQLSKVVRADGLIVRRAKLYERFPVREMIKQGWIEASKVVEVLEQQLRDFFSLKSLDDPIEFSHAARKTQAEAPANPLQFAWLFRARRLAAELKPTVAYSRQALEAALPRLAALRSAPEEARHVARLLAESGVRFVVVEPIPGSKLDGACFWLGAEPVVALSLRLDRIDNFWFVLRHEIEHVIREHGREGFVLDQDLEGTDATSEEERVANQAGQSFCVAEADMVDFMNRVGPFYSEQRVVGCASRLGIHPGLVVGQLQRRLDNYAFLRRYQAKIRSIVTATARTDGWGVIHSL